MKDWYANFIEDGMITLPQKLLSHYKQLGLNETELVLCLSLYSFKQANVPFPTLEEISERMTISSNQCSMHMRSLIQRNIIMIEEAVSEDGRFMERYTLKPLWELLYQLDVRTIEMEKKQKQLEESKDVYSMFEQEFGRALSPIELEMIGNWLDEDDHTVPFIKAALREAVISSKLNFRYIDRILLEWKKKGYTSLEQIQAHSEKFRRAQQQRASFSTTNEEIKRPTAPIYNWLEANE
ncbi:DnaD domain-containing protein [Mangrovibacillus cuniculi]|uniref:DnaD domain-containing protein n=1 Tax=Mangrovibacillus cuniculi TaxID=2593652 RepID=A0A7S8CB22_9BACI|nr:DnaD domain-containing protein [Mangrovibacillus cuniculi]QPC46668.1 DnaD domain-containing protein [Mangrovibacillus cuniculi]